MRRVSIFVLLVALVGGTPRNMQADASKATVTIHYRSCPYGYVHQEYAELCANNPVAYGQIGFSPGDGTFFTDEADADGNITFQLESGLYYISIGALKNLATDTFQSCVANHPAALSNQALILRAGDIVTCDYYVVLGAQDGSVPPEDSLPPGAGHIRYFGANQCQEPVVMNVSGVTTFPKGGCSTGSGVRIDVTTGDGAPIGSCVTEAPEGYCALHVFANSAIVQEDVSSLPGEYAGYAPQANPIVYDAVHGGNSVLFVNIPIAAMPTVAPADSSITVHGRVCPAGYEGTNYFTDCHGNLPTYQQLMALAGSLGGADYLAKPIDPEGNVSFTQLVPERYQLTLGLPSDTRSTFVACSESGSPSLPIKTSTSSSAGWSATEIDLKVGQDIICDAYAIPPAA